MPCVWPSSEFVWINTSHGWNSWKLNLLNSSDSQDFNSMDLKLSSACIRFPHPVRTQRIIPLFHPLNTWEEYLAFFSHLCECHSEHLILYVLLVCKWYSLSQCLLHHYAIKSNKHVVRQWMVEPLNRLWHIRQTGRLHHNCEFKTSQ